MLLRILHWSISIVFYWFQPSVISHCQSQQIKFPFQFKWTSHSCTKIIEFLFSSFALNVTAALNGHQPKIKKKIKWNWIDRHQLEGKHILGKTFFKNKQFQVPVTQQLRQSNTPHIDPYTGQNQTVQLGETAIITCKIYNVANRYKSYKLMLLPWKMSYNML